MNRRGFIQISATALLPILLGIFPRRSSTNKIYSLEVLSNRSFGHLLRESSSTLPTSEIETDYIIVGGGVAGVAAATRLKDKKFMLFEADDRLGGSSASGSWKSAYFALGAHYELAYPTSFGKEVIDLLKELEVIYYNEESDLYEFNEKEYVIKLADAEQCYDGEKISPDILTDAEGLADFNKIVERFAGKMHLPTRLIAQDLHYLNSISFKDFLEKEMNLSADLEQRISYQMLDDWGGTCAEVSALAGIHYYVCRPYFEQDVELFSPPNGNSYFVQKMVGQIPTFDSFQVNKMVRKIVETEDGVEVEVLDRNGTVALVRAKGLIYAGQKHALKYILPTEQPIFSTDYAPWVVVNIVCAKGLNFEKWQNDVLTPELNFLGFVNSLKQETRSEEYDVLTAYYCFKKEERAQLEDIEKDPRKFVDSTIQLIEDTTKISLAESVEHVTVNLLGHAMPIPKPGYLTFQEVPQYSNKIVFAGVDTGRLPLFLEACDSGLQAADRLLKNLEINPIS